MFEKIIEKLEELQQEQLELLCEHKAHLDEQCAIRGFNCLKRAIDKVNKVAEEYNNGWIPCSERLPDIHEGKTQSEEVYTVVEWEDGEITYSVGWYNKSGKWNEDSKICKVVAWKPIQLYIQKGE